MGSPAPWPAPGMARGDYLLRNFLGTQERVALSRSSVGDKTNTNDVASKAEVCETGTRPFWADQRFMTNFLVKTL